MRNGIKMFILAALSSACVAAGACSSGGEKTNPADGDTGDYSAGAAPTLGPKPGSCANFFQNKNKCGACAEEKCCPVLTECMAASGCKECLTGNQATCEKNKTILDKLGGCAQSQCANECKPPPPPAPACDAAPTARAGASCIKLGPKAACDPVTNGGCASGQVCDIGQKGFECHQPTSATVGLCDECSRDKGLCGGGLTCIGKCAKYCCDNSECGSGKCDKSIMNDPDLPIGICVVK